MNQTRHWFFPLSLVASCCVIGESGKKGGTVTQMPTQIFPQTDPSVWFGLMNYSGDDIQTAVDDASS